MGRSYTQLERVVPKPVDSGDSDDSTRMKSNKVRNESRVAVVEKTKRKKVEEEGVADEENEEQLRLERKQARKAAKEAARQAEAAEQERKDRKAAKKAAKEAARQAEELAEATDELVKETKKAEKQSAEEAEAAEQERKDRKAAKKAAKEAARQAEELAEEQKAEGKGLKRKKCKEDEVEDTQSHKKAKTDPTQAAPHEEKAIAGPQEEFEDVVEVRVSGSNSKSQEMNPWMQFKDVKTSGPGGCLPPRAIEFLQKDKGFKKPTAIQSYCWPIACAERDLIGIAKTGSGKTIAFLLPMFPRIMIAKTGFKKGPYMVVLAPTRELAVQIEQEAVTLQKCTGVRTVCVYGGAPKGQQINALSKGTDILVGCPGRMNDFLDNVDKFTGKTILSLENCTSLVLDEADRMLDMGFEPQIRKVLGHITSKRQTMLFSATWPKEVRALASEFLDDPIQVRVGSGDSFQGNKDIEQRIVVLDSDSAEEASARVRKEELLKILKAHPNEMCLIFCAMKRTAADLANDLWKEQMSVRGIHGDLDQWARDEALRCFRTGEAKILVATDVAARGLDIKGIALVVNYDPAGNQEDHVHRIGRTGRAGQKGVAYTFLGKGDIRQAQEIVQVFQSAGQEVPQHLQEVASQRLNNWKTRKAAMWNRSRYGSKGGKGGKGGSGRGGGKGGKGKGKR